MGDVYIYILKNIKIFFIGQSLYLSLSCSLSSSASSLLLLLFLFKITKLPCRLTNSRLSVIFPKIGNWSNTLKSAANFGKGNGFVE